MAKEKYTYDFDKEQGFQARKGGFKIAFDNGVVVSVQFTRLNYCTISRDEWIPMKENSSPNAEVAIYRQNKEGFITKQCPQLDDRDNVCGYVDPEEVVKVLDWASRQQFGDDE